MQLMNLPPPTRASLVARLVKNPPAMQEAAVRFLGQEGPLEKEEATHSQQYSRASLVVQLVKNLPTMRETWVQSLAWEDPLEKGKATHSSVLAWRIHGLQSILAKSRTRLSDFSVHASHQSGRATLAPGTISDTWWQ